MFFFYYANLSTLNKNSSLFWIISVQSASKSDTLLFNYTNIKESYIILFCEECVNYMLRKQLT